MFHWKLRILWLELLADWYGSDNYGKYCTLLELMLTITLPRNRWWSFGFAIQPEGYGIFPGKYQLVLFFAGRHWCCILPGWMNAKLWGRRT